MDALPADYAAFLAAKAPKARPVGIEPGPMPAHLFDYQAHCVAFGLRAGRAAIFLGTGLGKTRIQLEWARQAAGASNECALILAPLAVGWQIADEGRSLGYDVRVVRDATEVRPGINVCNYDRLDQIDPEAFGAVSADESGIIKNLSGATTRAMIRMFGGTRFRLACTATPAPNDHMELGTHAEFLGVMQSNEMLSRWFKNDTSTASQTWRLKRHAEAAFWDWVASWAVCADSPSDLGFDGSRHVLPPLEQVRHHVQAEHKPQDGTLFGADLSATTMHETKRRTAGARAALVREIVLGSQTCAETIPNTCGPITRPTETNGSVLPNSESAEMLCAGKSMQPTPSTETASSEQLRIKGRKTLSHTRTKNCENPSVSKCRTTELYLGNRTVLAPSAEPEIPGRADTYTLTTVTKPGKSEGCSALHATWPSGSFGTTRTTFGRPSYTSMKVPHWVLWCDSNDEQDALEVEFGSIAVSIRGSMTAEQKEYLHGVWLSGERPVLISKSTIFGFGMNWQHCSNMAFIGRTFSYEQWYQAVRRCWRFGQTRPVHVHIVVAEGEEQIGRVVDRKADDHAKMKQAMAAAMHRARPSVVETKVPYTPKHEARMPAWL